MAVGIIGGSGLSKFVPFSIADELVVETPYGRVEVQKLDYEAGDLYFVARHGSGHGVPPHEVNYRANVRALKDLGVERIFSTTAVGSVNLEMLPGTFVVPDQIIDFTHRRAHTYCEVGRVYHIDMTEPLCGELREALRAAAEERGEEVVYGATYVVTEGPRFETPAEIRAFRTLGGDLVGMTLMPECSLARELGMCYATLSVVTNLAAGIQGERLTAREVDEMMREKLVAVAAILKGALGRLPLARRCGCGSSLADAEV